MIQLFVAMNPVGKARARKGGNHWYTPEATAEAEQAIKGAFMAYKGAGIPWGIPIALGVYAQFVRPKSCPNIRRYPMVRPDADNILKLVADALNGLAWKDDSAVVYADVLKEYTDSTPGLTIVIHEYDK